MASPAFETHLGHAAQNLSNLRIVLLGPKRSGKSSSGNTILGREEFNAVETTIQCVKRQGDVAGREVTVVEAPGWWWNCQLKDTPEQIKDQIKLSVSLCPPGPHALLLVIRLDASFAETQRRSVQEHLELLGERVWSHTIALFTRGDWLGDTPIEQHIESGGKALQWVVEKCGNRYHVLNNQKRHDHMQVTQLMEKIEEMVAENNEQHEMDRQRTEELQEKRRREQERVKERMMKVKRPRESLRSSMGDTHHLSELKIVLLGYTAAGKSSSGNSILGREEFNAVGRTAQCVKRQGEVAGRQVTVVEAPGWNYQLEETPQLTKEEIELSVSLCSPGPHALLLAIPLDNSFTETDRRSVQEHMELLGERVWSHTIVLFTHGDWLGDTTIEQHIGNEGESLHWLVERCGNRYHVLNNQKRYDHMQVTQLMEKIEEMVAKTNEHHYEMDRQRIEELQEKRRREQERVKERMMKVKRKTESFRSQMREEHHLSKLRIVLLGSKDAGKSSSGNSILGREEFDAVGRRAQCVKRHGEVAGREVTVVEAPGWWWNFQLKDTPQLTKEEIELSVSLCPPGPHTLLLVICVETPFTQMQRRSVQEHLELLGERVWSHTIVLFTHGDWLGNTPIEQHIESEGESLQWVVEKCENRYHVLNNQKRHDHMQVIQLMEKIDEMVAGNAGQQFEMERQRIKELRRKRRKKEERIQERKKRMNKQRASLRLLMGEGHHQSEFRIVLLGYRVSGKSSSGNTILGREEFDTVGTTTQCVKKQGDVAGREVTVVEAPGWWRNLQLKKSTEQIKDQIELSVSLCPPGPHALLLVIRLDTSFRDTQRIPVQEHLELLGERVWSHTIVLFTHGDWLGNTTIEQHIESEGESLQWLVEKCGGRYHVLNNQKRDDHMQVTQLMKKIEEMVAKNRGQHFEMGARQEELQAAAVKKAGSYDHLPPTMSTKRWSLASSAYGSSGSLTEHMSALHTSESSLASMGIGSRTSMAGSVESLERIPSFSNFSKGKKAGNISALHTSVSSLASSGIGSLTSMAGSVESLEGGPSFSNFSKVNKALSDLPEAQEASES